jgi:N,N'-diacetyllegionaminate synthase
MERVYIIAEAGINHNGNLNTAVKMIELAAKAGVDAIKFQTFKAEKVISVFAPKAEYQKRSTGTVESQLEMALKLELSFDDFRILAKTCEESNLTFLSTAFDPESIDFLNKLGLDFIKIPSGELTNLPYLRKVAQPGKKVLLSTGMANLGEIEQAIDILTSHGTNRDDITILHCSTDYPTTMEDVNLSAMLTMQQAFKLPVGYSDHSLGIEIPIAAVALGASVIEKHFTLDKKMSGPDHDASLSPDELNAMVIAIRNIEKAYGDGIKRPGKGEAKNLDIARRSIVAAEHIRPGELFSEINLTVKRPGTGISPMQWDTVIGKKAAKFFHKDTLIEI